MSRIAKKPIKLPAGVTVAKAGANITVSGPLGTLSRTIRPEVEVAIEGNQLLVKLVGASRHTAAYGGTTRSLIANMVEGVSRGFEKKLEIEGIGYRATTDGTMLQLSLRLSHPVRIEAPPGVTFRVEKNVITISGIDVEAIGDVAARIRSCRPPEPYKGKGIRYPDEVIRRKAGKKAVTAAT